MAGNAVARTAPVQSAPVQTGGLALALPPRQSELLAQARVQIEPYLPRGITFEAVISDVFLATRKNADLLKCDPESLVLAVVEVQQRGLRIGSTCHLVPKGGKVCAWNDWRGDLEMVIASGACRDGDAHVVYENESFHYVELLGGPELRHEIIFDAKDRGAIRGAYAKFYLGGGRYRVKYMPVDDIDAIRQAHSLNWKKGSIPDWYCRKTVIRQGAKLLPKNPALLKVYATFNRDEPDAEFSQALGASPEPTVVRDGDGDLVDVETGEIVEPNAPTASADATPSGDAVEKAKAMPFPFQRGKPINGRPMGELPSELLSSVASWIVEKQDEKNDSRFHAETLEAINLIIADREKDQTTLALEEPPIDDAATAGAASTSYVVPPPGRVEDAFRGELGLNDRQPAPNRNALSEL